MGRYSHAVRSDKPVLYLSGQMGEDPNTNEIVQGGIEAQTVSPNATCPLSHTSNSH